VIVSAGYYHPSLTPNLMGVCRGVGGFTEDSLLPLALGIKTPFANAPSLLHGGGSIGLNGFFAPSLIAYSFRRINISLCLLNKRLINDLFLKAVIPVLGHWRVVI